MKWPDCRDTAPLIYKSFLSYTNEFDFVRSIYSEILKVDYGFDRSTIKYISWNFKIPRFWKTESVYVHRKEF